MSGRMIEVIGVAGLRMQRRHLTERGRPGDDLDVSVPAEGAPWR